MNNSLPFPCLPPVMSSRLFRCLPLRPVTYTQCTDSVLSTIQSNSAAKNLHCKSYCFAICSIGFGLTTGQLSISRTLEHPRGKLDQNTLFVRKYENNEQSAIICRQKAPAMKAGSIIAASESVLRLESVLLPSRFLS